MQHSRNIPSESVENWQMADFQRANLGQKCAGKETEQGLLRRQFCNGVGHGIGLPEIPGLLALPGRSPLPLPRRSRVIRLRKGEGLLFYFLGGSPVFRK